MFNAKSPAEAKKLAQDTGLVYQWDAGGGWIGTAYMDRGKVVSYVYRAENPNYRIY